MLTPEVEVQATRDRTWTEPCDPANLERGARQLLANKLSGNLLGIWLLVPEHLRLGTWDLLRAWSGRPGEQVEPRLALQLVHEAALCVTGIREGRSLSHKGFELANGLPFLASDQAVNRLLDAHCVADGEALQLALGKLRRARGHYAGRLLAIDPHRMTSYSRRHMRLRQESTTAKPAKASQGFFCLDPDTCQPVCFTIGCSARTVAQVTPELLLLAARILNPEPGTILALADGEHFVAELVDHINTSTPFDLLVPMHSKAGLLDQWRAATYTPRWAGFATARLPYQMFDGGTGPLYQCVQRCGELPEEYHYQGFLCTAARDEVEALTTAFPERWHVEEFFNSSQDLGWRRGRTLNLNIRYGQMTMALIAQAALYQLRQRLGDPFASWDAAHLAEELLQGLDGDVRVHEDTIIVTFYNAPNAEALRSHYEQLPERLHDEGVEAGIPWLYGLKLDFRFK